MQYPSRLFDRLCRPSAHAAQLAAISVISLLFAVGCGSSAFDPPPLPDPSEVGPPQASNNRSGLPPGAEADFEGPIPANTAKAPAARKTGLPPGAEPDLDAPVVATPPKNTKQAVAAAGKANARAALPPGAEPDLDAAPATPTPPPALAASNMVPGAEPDLDAPSALQTPAQPDVPRDIGEWKANDFRLARQKRNPRLVAAVRTLGKGTTLNSDPKANAILLAELLQSPSQNDATASVPGAEPSDMPAANAVSPISGLAEAVTEALSANGTPEAHTTLKNILLGKQPSDIPDRMLTTAALRTLAANFTEENQRILAAVLTAPNSIRPAGRGQLTADQLQDECLRIVRTIASPEFRLLLAQRAPQGAVSAIGRQRLIAMLTTAETMNIPAQVELSITAQLDAAARANLDLQLAQASQRVLDRLLSATAADWLNPGTAKIPVVATSDEGAVAPAASFQTLEFHEVANFARHLWRADFCSLIAARVKAATNPEAEPALFALAASLPVNSVRSALADRWEKQWTEEGPSAKALLQFSAGSLSTGPREPGLLLLLKQLPRESPRALTADAAAKARRPVTEASENPQATRQAKEQAGKQEWLKTSEIFLDSLISYFAKVAELQARAPSAANSKAINSIDDFNSLINSKPSASAVGSAESSPPFAFPPEWKFSLHAPADVQVSYQLNWPSDFQAPLRHTATNPLTIRYVRLNSLGDLNALANFYDRQLKLPFSRALEKGRWIDGVVKLDDGRLRTVDVRITRVDAANPPARGTQERLIVDVLCIEAADPKQPAANLTVK